MAEPAKKKRRRRGEGALFKRADGLWVARIERAPDPATGKRSPKVVTARDRNDCIAKRDAYLESVKQGADPYAKTVTVEGWMNHWLAEIAPHRKVGPKQMASYRTAARQHIIPALGPKRLDQLRPQHIRAMLKAITDTKKLSTRSAEVAFNVLSPALDDAMREGVITYNPCRRMPRPGSTSKVRGTIDADGFRRLFDYLGQLDAATASRIAMALFTGKRQGECLGLEWNRVGWDTKLIDISWQLQRLKQKGKTRIPRDTTDYPIAWLDVPAHIEVRPIWRTMCLIRPKWGKTSVVPMVAPLEALLREHHSNSGAPRDGLVWTRPDGTPITPQDDTKVWADAMTACELLDTAGKPLTLHSARHTLATLLLEAKVEESVRMEIMGQSTVAAHRGYVHVDQTHTRAALDQIAGLLGK